MALSEKIAIEVQTRVPVSMFAHPLALSAASTDRTRE
jgi:hypothetical protein